MYRFGYIDTVLTADELLSQPGYDLFVKTSIPGHSLHHLLPRIVVVTYVNVDGGYAFHLPEYNTALFKKSFIVRSLYKFVT